MQERTLLTELKIIEPAALKFFGGQKSLDNFCAKRINIKRSDPNILAPWCCAWGVEKN